MKKLNLFLVTFLALLIYSCSSDDSEPSFSAKDFSLKIDENQSTDKELGTINASSNNGELTFSITSQTPDGALSIDAKTGKLSVADASSFDFETNPIITAKISVSDNSITESINATITLNDIDDIEHILTDSKANYTSASNGDWILITESEYNKLANKLNEITKTGLTDTEYSANVVSSAVGPHSRANHTTKATIPKNGYIIAFKYKVKIANNVVGVKIKQSSTANNDGYSDIGNELPSHSGNSEDIFFVLKGSDTPVTANGYLGLFQPKDNISISLISATNGNGAYWGNGDTSSIKDGQWSNLLVIYQGLSTTQKQW